MELSRLIWAPFAKNHEIHEESYELLARLIELQVKPSYELGVQDARKQALELAADFQGTTDFKGEDTEITIPSPTESEGIPASVYKPDSCEDDPPILVFFHGGGLVTMERNSIATPLKIIAMEAGAIVVNVEYRLHPNKEVPTAPFDDAIAATRWVMENRKTVGGTDASKVGVGGDSSGGHITACVTNEVMDLDFQIMVYPVTDTSLSQDSFTEFETCPLLSKREMEWFIENSMDFIPNHTKDPRYNPMARTNTETSPCALLILVELDVLVGSGLEYAEKLRTAGVPVQCEVIKGAPHAIFTTRTITKTMSAEAYDHIVKFIRELGNPRLPQRTQDTKL